MLVFFVATMFGVGAFAQVDKDKVKQVLESKNFVFKAQSASPSGGRVRSLTGEYDLRIFGDSLVTYLPYFGRAYTAPMPGESGINFSTSDFDYKLDTRKKGGWEITMLPKDVRDVRQLFLTVTESGYATLQVTSNNRQPISFNGYIVERK